MNDQQWRDQLINNGFLSENRDTVEAIFDGVRYHVNRANTSHLDAWGDLVIEVIKRAPLKLEAFIATLKAKSPRFFYKNVIARMTPDDFVAYVTLSDVPRYSQEDTRQYALYLS